MILPEAKFGAYFYFVPEENLLGYIFCIVRAFKLLTQAERRWRRVNSPHLVALVAAGVKFPDGETRILPNLPSDSVVNLQVDVALEPAIHNI